MKRYIISLFTAVLSMMCLTGCLTHGIDGPEELFDGADITGLQGVYYRYIDNSGKEPAVKQITLARGADINTEENTMEIACQAPSNFPDDQLPNLKATELVVVLNISTAAVIEPLDGAPKLGVPGDWSKPNRYQITAANGDKKIWTITLELIPR